MVLTGFSQKGPGGVSLDTDDQKNCRLWLDAGDLDNLADGDSVIVWYDKSISAIRDSAFRDPAQADKYTYPIYRNSPSASVNGKPVVSFESGGMLGIGKWPEGPPSTDLNSNPGKITTYEQTLFFAFRTSNDVTERQIIWEEGGAERGITTYINDSYVYIGAYDVNGGDADFGSGSVPKFGFTYKRLPVQANTTYVLAFKYNVNPNNTLIYNTTPTPTYTGLTGTLNGQDFPTTMEKGGGPGVNCSSCATAVGGIWKHEDPIGIGGLNQGSYHEQGRIYGGNDPDPIQNSIKRNTYTGTHLFKGRIAEICYYAYALDKAEQIIVENYLAAKYFANVIANDKFIYESSYGDGVIGIGREQAMPTIEHNVSQGDNLFEISVGSMGSAFTSAPQYLLVGHNNGMVSWTNQNTPDSSSVQRLRRTWRWDRSGTLPSPTNRKVTLRMTADDISKLPPLPPGYTKYGVIIGDETQSLPNFTADHAEVFELLHNADTSLFSVNITVQKGSYLTLCAIKPVVQFRLNSDFAIEGNTGTTPKTAEIYLNYTPALTTTYDVNFNFIDGSAVLTDDYTWTPADSPLTFSAGASSKTIDFEIVNDATVVNDLPVETFTIELTSANNGLSIGARNTLVYSIYDNDPPPKVTFQEGSASYNEGAGEIYIPLNIVGALSGSATATVEYVPGSGTATLGEDFTVVSPQTLNFSSTVLTDFFVLHILEDLTDEYDENLTLRITNTTGDLGFDDTLNIEINIQIIDNDLPPEVSFVSAESEGYESISEPLILVKLSAKSAKQILVPFSLTGGTATNDAISPGGDYTAAPSGGTLIFQAGDSVRALYQDNITAENHIIVYGNDEPNEPDETIEFELDIFNLTNATPGSITSHIYTIKDYSEFEWVGVAGIGKLNDNTIWMVPDAATSGSDIPNLSPRPIQILQNNPTRTPTLTSRAAGLNNKKLIQFDGVDDYIIPGNTSAAGEGQSSLMQTAAFYDSKSIFFVFIPEEVNSNIPQCIFEAGAQRTGMSIYIVNNTLYFQAWGWQDNLNPSVLWGLNVNDKFKSLAYTEYSGLIKDKPYIISCHYENNTSATATMHGLSLFVNGELVDWYDGNVDRFQNTVGSAAIGSVLWQSRFFDTQYFTNVNGSQCNVPSKTQGTSSNFFKGKLGDLLYYNEPKMNLARVRIITNYLSARYNIELESSAQVFDLDYADNTPSATMPAFNNEVAGLGEISGQTHGDSKGESELRVRNAQHNNSTAFLMWGNNNESLTNTWPVSSAVLPAGIRERSAKVWRFSANPATGTSTADFYIRYSSAENAAAFSANEDFLKLLISNDPNDFSSATAYPVSLIKSGHIAQFNSIPITDGMYVALGNSSAIYPLPIELLNFTAKLMGEVVDINWTTTSEINNEYFVIERAEGDLKWKEIATIQGAGNSNTTLYYNEKDRNPLPGISYYRLKQVDFDGNYKYSDVVSVVNDVNSTSDDVYIFPNPASSGSVFVRLPYAFAEAETNISIYSLSGIKVWHAKTAKNAPLIELKYGSLPAGIYFVEVVNPFLKEVKKLVIE